MNLNELLKNFRINSNMTQEALAKKLHVSHQTISKWEQGINTPSIDNLLMLSDLYNISLDELIRGGNYLKKPFIMGTKNSVSRIFIIFVLLIIGSIFLVGIWDISFVIVPIIFFLGAIFIFPMTVEDYWILENRGISIKIYPKSVSRKIKELAQNLTKLSNENIFIPYNEIETFEIVYQRKDRYSPFDYRADDFFVRITSNKGEKYSLLVKNNFVKFLPQITSYLTKKNITVMDNHDIVEAIIRKKYLFDYVRDQDTTTIE
ncbi:helix-turn-helix domain-containing protein [Enterococcus sp. LJL90]